MNPRNPAKAASTELRIFFVNGSSSRFVLREMSRGLRRGDIIGLFVASVVGLAILAGERLYGDLPTLSRAVLALLSAITFLLLYSSLITQAALIARLRGWRRVYEPALTAMAAVPVALAAQGMIALFEGNTIVTRQATLSAIVLHLLFWEALVSVYFLFLLPSLLRGAALQTQESPQSAQPDSITIGSHKFLTSEIRRISSDDHYLVVHMTEGTLRLNGRLRDAANQLEAHGMVVHRSHWLAFDMFGPLETVGRQCLMTTASGDSVPVSRVRRADVVAILAARQRGA